MDKEIKFRTWDNLINVMEVFTLDNEFDCINGWMDDSILMQYTGLKDKNGVEIYDGDIIKNFQADINVVHWYGNGWCYQNYHANSLPLDDLWNPYDDASNEAGERFTGHEVVGNIHQNPELLNNAL